MGSRVVLVTQFHHSAHTDSILDHCPPRHYVSLTSLSFHFPAPPSISTLFLLSPSTWRPAPLLCVFLHLLFFSSVPVSVLLRHPLPFPPVALPASLHPYLSPLTGLLFPLPVSSLSRHVLPAARLVTRERFFGRKGTFSSLASPILVFFVTVFKQAESVTVFFFLLTADC